MHSSNQAAPSPEGRPKALCERSIGHVVDTPTYRSNWARPCFRSCTNISQLTYETGSEYVARCRSRGNQPPTKSRHRTCQGSGPTTPSDQRRFTVLRLTLGCASRSRSRLPGATYPCTSAPPLPTSTHAPPHNAHPHPDPENRTHAKRTAFPSVPPRSKSVSKQEKDSPERTADGTAKATLAGIPALPALKGASYCINHDPSPTPQASVRAGLALDTPARPRRTPPRCAFALSDRAGVSSLNDATLSLASPRSHHHRRKVFRAAPSHRNFDAATNPHRPPTKPTTSPHFALSRLPRSVHPSSPSDEANAALQEAYREALQ